MGARTSTRESRARAAALTANPLTYEVEFLLARAASSGTREGNRRLAPLRLRVRSYSVLSLACQPHPPSQRDLAEFLDLDPSQVVALVDDLEKRGFVERRVDAEDRRAKVVCATTAGRELCARAADATEGAEADSLAALTVEQRRQLAGLLRTLLYGADAADAG